MNPLDDEISAALPAKARIIRDYRDLRVWKQSTRLAEECERLSDSFSPHGKAMGDQIRSISRGVPARIAEGQTAGRLRIYLELLHEATDSLTVLEDALIRAYSAGWVKAEVGDRLLMKVADIRRMLKNLVKSLEAVRAKWKLAARER
jgi:four helix bundle protein